MCDVYVSLLACTEHSVCVSDTLTKTCMVYLMVESYCLKENTHWVEGGSRVLAHRLIFNLSIRKNQIKEIQSKNHNVEKH